MLFQYIIRNSSDIIRDIKEYQHHTTHAQTHTQAHTKVIIVIAPYISSDRIS